MTRAIKTEGVAEIKKECKVLREMNGGEREQGGDVSIKTEKIPKVSVKQEPSTPDSTPDLEKYFSDDELNQDLGVFVKLTGKQKALTSGPFSDNGLGHGGKKIPKSEEISESESTAPIKVLKKRSGVRQKPRRLIRLSENSVKSNITTATTRSSLSTISKKREVPIEPRRSARLLKKAQDELEKKKNEAVEPRNVRRSVRLQNRKSL